jgi:hypothetical protein
VAENKMRYQNMPPRYQIRASARQLCLWTAISTVLKLNGSRSLRPVGGGAGPMTRSSGSSWRASHLYVPRIQYDNTRTSSRACDSADALALAPYNAARANTEVASKRRIKERRARFGSDNEAASVAKQKRPQRTVVLRPFIARRNPGWFGRTYSRQPRFRHEKANP